MRAAILLAALAVLGGCATTPPMANSSFRAEFDRLETDCTTRGGMLTPTLKVRRAAVEAHHHAALEALYA